MAALDTRINRLGCLIVWFNWMDMFPRGDETIEKRRTGKSADDVGVWAWCFGRKNKKPETIVSGCGAFSVYLLPLCN
jgi:hypothetical protein